MNLSSAAGIAQSGLNAVTSEMSLVSRNIAGAGNNFYSRKTASVVSTGSGSQVGTVTRVSNLAVFTNLLSATASAATQDTLSTGLSNLAATLGDLSTGDGSPAALLSSFTNALQSYASTPSDSTAASNAVSAADALATALNSASGVVQSVRSQADANMAQSVHTINSLLGQFQALNQQVVTGTASGADVTDLEDQRDSVLSQLSNEIGITTTIGANGDMSIYTDSGVTMFQGGSARSVTFTPTSTYTPSTTGNAVYVDGVPVTGTSAAMAISSGNLAGDSMLRDNISVTYQAQLDNIAGALINSFAESDQVGSGPELPGLFTSVGTSTLPTTTVGLAATISVNPNVDPGQGGNANLLRDGGISSPGNSDYTYNTTGQASYTGRINQLIGNLSDTLTFGANGGLGTQTTIGGYAAASVSWLSSQQANVASEKSYQDVLLSTATSALSNSSGVNIDTEMSNMLTLEQSYSASAKLISTIDNMFSALLNVN